MQDPRKRPPPPARRYLAPEIEAKVRELWLAGASRDEVARAAGLSVDTLRLRLHDQLADLPRRGRGGNHRAPTPDPTPDEIAARAAELRRSWTPERYLPPPREELEPDAINPFIIRRR